MKMMTNICFPQRILSRCWSPPIFLRYDCFMKCQIFLDLNSLSELYSLERVHFLLKCVTFYLILFFSRR